MPEENNLGKNESRGRETGERKKKRKGCSKEGIDSRWKGIRGDVTRRKFNAVCG